MRISEPSTELKEAFRKQLRENPPSRILILGREHLGDLVNSTGAIDALQRAFPKASITFEGGEGAIEVLRGHPGISTLWGRPRRQGLLGKLAAVNRYRQGRFDLAVVLDDSRVYLRLSRLAGIKMRAGVKRKLYPDYTIWTPFSEDIHETIELFRRLLDTMGIDTSEYRPNLSPSVAGAEEMERVVAEAAPGLDASAVLVAIHPGASIALRTWPHESFLSLIDAVGARGWVPLLTGGTDDPVAEAVAAARPNAISLVGKLSPLGLVSLMDRVSALVVGDTGPMHVAAARGLPLVALYGPSEPAHTGPTGDLNRILLGECNCPVRSIFTCQGTCLARIRVKDVMQALETFLT